MKVRTHADDFGLTLQISQDILDCFERGVLHSTSMIVNGYAVEESLQLAQKHIEKGLSIHLHLNFMEGRPLSSQASLPLLTNERGEFKWGFAQLWGYYSILSKQKKQMLRRQLREEMEAQIQTFLQLLPNQDLCIDSHQHYHLIPFVADELIRLSQLYSIKKIRLPREPFFLTLPSAQSCGLHMGINFIKHSLLNILSARLAPKLFQAQINHNQSFLGVLCTGNMSLQSVKDGLKQVGEEEEVEILFHPGGAANSELSFWNHRPALQRYYRSPNRVREKELLLSLPFRHLVSSYQSLH